MVESLRTLEARVRADHTCACEQDDPSLRVMTQRQGPQHISVRFWEEDYSRARMRETDILLDGVKVEGVFEAVLGEQGTIWRYRGVPSAAGEPRHVCLTCLGQGRGTEQADWSGAPGTTPGICMEKLNGQVELRAKARTEDRDNKTVLRDDNEGFQPDPGDR